MATRGLAEFFPPESEERRRRRDATRCSSSAAAVVRRARCSAPPTTTARAELALNYGHAWTGRPHARSSRSTSKACFIECVRCTQLSEVQSLSGTGLYRVRARGLRAVAHGTAAPAPLFRPPYVLIVVVERKGVAAAGRAEFRIVSSSRNGYDKIVRAGVEQASETVIGARFGSQGQWQAQEHAD